jgi:peptide/nickel transport system permease protein
LNRILALLRRRVIAAIPVLAIIIVAVFVLLEAAPGDAVDAYLLSVGGGDAGMMESLRQQWGLDQSMGARLGLYLSRLAVGDLGWSVLFNRPILDVIVERLPVTLLLMGSATALSFLAGSLLGVIAGSRPGNLTDRLLSIGSLALYAIPSFWLGLVLAIVFAIQLRWLPTAGIETIASGKEGLVRTLDIARHLVLPVASLSLIYLALYLRMMRAGMAEIWREDFVRALQARGIPRHRIVWRHVARNALLPLVTLLGVQAAAMLGGSVVIESVFSVPGLGRLAQEAVAARDTPLLLGVILVSALFVILVNLLVDIVYAWLDPRIGAAGTEAP